VKRQALADSKPLEMINDLINNLHLFAFLGLLLFLSAAGAQELPLVKDSEAVHYVSKNVEVLGNLDAQCSPVPVKRVLGAAYQIHSAAAPPLKLSGLAFASPPSVWFSILLFIEPTM
jgi:hypothetical protein